MRKELNDKRGMWFLPDSPKDKLNGSINFDEDGEIKLKLFYNFGGLHELGSNNPLSVIQGFLSNGKKVTLFDCIQTNMELNMPGFPTTEYVCSNAIIGELYNDKEEVIITEMSAEYNYLNYWLNSNPFSISFNDSDFTKEVYMNYCMPTIESYKISSDETIEFTYKANTSSDRISNFEIHQVELVKFKFAEKVHYLTALNRVSDFADFLTLCIGKITTTLSVKAITTHGNEIELVYPKKLINKEVVKEHELYIKFTYIKDVFEECIKKWNEKKELLNPIIGYFVEAHEREFRIPMSFLKIVQAIEAYSRRMRNNEVLPPNEFESKVESIIAKIEKESDKELIKGMLSNEPRLRQRLIDIFKETNYIIEISSKKSKSLVNKIVNTRNYYTHFDKSIETKILKPEEMFYVARLLKLILRVELMQELGLDEELITQFMNNDQEILYVKKGLRL